jgi:hypothetical protein
MHAGHREAGQKRQRPRMVPALVLAVSALAVTGAAAAAPPNTAPHTPPGPKRAEPPKPNRGMRVIIITDSRPGCEPNCASWISAQGEITADTPAQFRRVFKLLGQKKLPIFVSSPGGSVPAGFAIGREIRKRGLDVAVERTIFQKCEQSSPCDLRALTDGDKGRPEPIGAYCASACVFLLAAGTERLVPVYGYVGVHQHHATQTMRKVLQTYQVQRRIENWRVVESRKVISEKLLSTTTTEMDPNYAPVRAYFTEMGINTATIMPLLLSTPHHAIHRMTPDERRTTRLVTRAAAGDVLLPSIPRTAEAKAVEARPKAVEPATRATHAKPDPVEPPVRAAEAKPAPVEPAARAAEAKPDAAEPPVRTAEAKPDPVEPAAARPPEADAVSKVAADLMLLYPPGGDTVDIFIRVRPVDVSLPAAEYTADLAFARGWKLTARSTGDGAADPLYAALDNQQFCTLHRGGDLSIKISLESPARPGRPLRMASDMSRAPGAVEFAAKHCGK